MHAGYLGDSYDLVKRFWRETLSDIAPLLCLRGFLPEEITERFTTLTGIGIYDENNPPASPFGLLLDPDTGISLPDSKTKKPLRQLIPVSYLGKTFDQYHPEFVICFDQSYDRFRRNRDSLDIRMQSEMKQKELGHLGIVSFYYRSHAPFLFMARNHETLHRIRQTLIRAGVPEIAEGKERLQKIDIRAPGPI